MSEYPHNKFFLAQRLGYGLNSSGFRPVLQNPERLWVPLNLLLGRYQNSFPGVIRTKRDVYHPILSSSEAKNECSYKSTRLVGLRATDRDNFTFTFTFTVNWQYFYCTRRTVLAFRRSSSDRRIVSRSRLKRSSSCSSTVIVGVSFSS